MPAEPQIPPQVIKELATAAIAKRKQDTKRTASGKGTRPLRISERALLELTKSLSEFYGYAAVARTNKEHRLMADLVAQTWAPMTEYDRQVAAKDQALEHIEELEADVAKLKADLEQARKDLPRLKSVIRTALGRLRVDTSEKHVKEEWAVVLLRHIETAREILKSESGVDAKA